jgi:TusA-related sulfurtransferase
VNGPLEDDAPDNSFECAARCPLPVIRLAKQMRLL